MPMQPRPWTPTRGPAVPRTTVVIFSVFALMVVSASPVRVRCSRTGRSWYRATSLPAADGLSAALTPTLKSWSALQASADGLPSPDDPPGDAPRTEAPDRRTRADVRNDPRRGGVRRQQRF